MIFDNVVLTNETDCKKCLNNKGFVMINNSHVLINIENYKRTCELVQMLLHLNKSENIEKFKPYTDIIYKIIG